MNYKFRKKHRAVYMDQKYDFCKKKKRNKTHLNILYPSLNLPRAFTERKFRGDGTSQ